LLTSHCCRNVSLAMSVLCPSGPSPGEQIRDTFADVAPPYFLEVLRVALERYDDLVAPRGLTFGANAEVRLTGAELCRRYRDGTPVPGWMGRRGGLLGPELAKDLSTGAWRTQRYECSSKAVANPNWFTVAEFIARVDALGPQRTGGGENAP
jgi:hypothetical protein